MSKRGAISELNDRNWDDEEEPEEAGVFQQAPDNVLNQRVFKKAKRRVINEESSGSKSSAFGGFGGFGLKAPQSKAAETFSGFKPTGSDVTFEARPLTSGGAASVNGSEDLNVKSPKDSKDSSYLNFLKSLNESVLAWIKQHVDNNPYIILTPIFKDYENYLKSVQSDSCNNNTGSKDLQSSGNGSATPKVPAVMAAAEVKAPLAFSFAAGTTGSLTSKASSIPTFSRGVADAFKFGQKTETSSSATPAFTFGSTNSQKTSFSFGLAKTSQDSNTAGSSQSQDADTKDDEEYVPPKPEVKEILEEDSLFSIRCKLFHQSDGKWVDRGVGNLHLKPVEEEKTQLLVRADTNLGNILLNILLSSSMPVNKQGKNNIVLVCIPNPPIDMKGDNTTPVPMLVRVKSEEDADALLKIIKERQQLL
ncbi:Nuclear pore complex protein Nup50 [Bulinus truncatus]|nr:Nuclear pore complex protein Nup50 [Bulinus truncatus]